MPASAMKVKAWRMRTAMLERNLLGINLKLVGFIVDGIPPH